MTLLETDGPAERPCGYVALVGRPNVGKSTLLNGLIGQKVSIVSRKPQTTRHRILGVHTTPDAQFIYVDTPGLHARAQSAMNRYLNRAASSVLADVDVVVFVVEALKWTEEDDLALSRLEQVKVPVVLVVNKVDLVKDKTRLLPYLAEVGTRRAFEEVVPLSALDAAGRQELERVLRNLLPLSVPLFPEDQITDRSERFLAAELIREQLMRGLGQELPYATTVEIEAFERDGALLRIAGLIWVERPGQKAIVLGKGGERIKRVGQQARIQMETLFGSKVYLQLWVKVREGWSDDERALRRLGYDEV